MTKTFEQRAREWLEKDTGEKGNAMGGLGDALINMAYVTGQKKVLAFAKFLDQEEHDHRDENGRLGPLPPKEGIEKEWHLIDTAGGSNAPTLVRYLQDGWQIERADATNSTVVYILSRAVNLLTKAQ